MRREHAGRLLICLLLVCAMALGLAGCGGTASAKNLMEGINPQGRNVAPAGVSSESAAKAADFAVRLLNACNQQGKSTLISPVSVLSALAMTANGAKGETLLQMERALGMTKEELNVFFREYARALPQGEKYSVSLANSIWFTDDERFTVNRDFLQVNADYYGADAYQAPFDNATLDSINNWVKEKTKGMIPKIIERISGESVMYLVNALAFEAEWAEIYEKNQVQEGTFTLEDGTRKNVEFMYGSEYAYISDERAEGFIKYYSEGKYAFVALLPKEGISVSAYIASLEGPELREMLLKPQATKVETAIPKFETEYEAELSGALKALGMSDAFHLLKADFTELGSWENENIYISGVLHKTFLSVGEKGTKAGAATAVEIKSGSAAIDEKKEVYLNRPFLYMLIDCESGIPLFIGSMMDAAI